MQQSGALLSEQASKGVICFPQCVNLNTFNTKWNGFEKRSERVRERSTAEHSSVQMSALWVRSVQIDALGERNHSLTHLPAHSAVLRSAVLGSNPLCSAHSQMSHERSSAQQSGAECIKVEHCRANERGSRVQ